MPNDHVRRAVNLVGLEGLDGELVLANRTAPFHQVSSAIMSGDGEPDFRFVAFDLWQHEGGYLERVAALERRAGRRRPKWLDVLMPDAADCERDLLRLEQRYLAEGYEGLMLRTPGGPYKHGRSTLREGYLLKLKRFADAEAVVIGCKEQMHNDNRLMTDLLGHAKRSTAKAGLVPAGVLGALELCRPDGVKFDLGTGFTAEQRAELWRARMTLPGRLVKYRFQPAGAKEAPRFPTFLGFRHQADAGATQEG